MEDKLVRVLLIEDNPEDIGLLDEVLARPNGSGSKFKFHYARRLEEGLLKLTEGGIDVIVLDLSLPECSGMDTLVTLQSKAQGVPIVVLTALDDEAKALEAVGRGAQDYLVKGRLDHYIFVRAVLHAIERSKIRTEIGEVTAALREANLRLERLILMDPLTELLNRRGLQDALSREVLRMRRDESDLLALILDLDNFKHINDTFGHAVGDVVLKEISQKIKRTVRQMDYVARIGGDEFLILMPQTRIAEGARVAEKIRRAIAADPVSLSLDRPSPITASLGLVEVTEQTTSIDELMTRTHHALYQSKNRGKNKVSYDTRYHEPREADLTSLSENLASFHKNKQYRVLKQPIFDLAARIEIGYEFLTRFCIEGFEMPEDFFLGCLENNILTQVDHRCLRNSVESSRSIRTDARRHFNLFPSTMIDVPLRDLIEPFRQLPTQSNCCIEISEQQIIGDPSYLKGAVDSFREAGLLIAIDDVGFGRSCLESLILLEPDIVKIDKKWVNGISHNEWCLRSLVKMLKVTQAIGAEVIAEGIETSEDMEVLIGLGVKYGQGYFLGRPV